MIDGWLSSLGTLINETSWLAPVLALLAGVLTSFTPCSLSSIPLVIGYVGGGENKPAQAFKMSLIFAAGSAVTFTLLGTLASLAGRLIGANSGWWYGLLGVLMVLMALQTWELFNFIPSTYLVSKNKRRGYLGALLAGILGGIFSSPCATPVLVVLLAIVAGKGSIGWGMLLLFLYAVGHGTLTVIAGTSMGWVRSIARDSRYGVFSNWMKWIMGGLILLIGFYMFYLAF